MKQRGNRKLQTVWIALAWLFLWQLAAWALGNKLLLPSPLETAGSLVVLCQEWMFWQSVGMTLLRIMAAFLIGMAVGTALGALSYRSRLADAFLAPIRGLMKATPVTSFIILLLLWFSTSIAPVISALLTVIPIFWVNVHEGLAATDAQLLEMAYVFRFSQWKRLKHIYAPSLLPQFIAACMTSVGFAWKSGVAAEVIASSKFSIGGNLYASKIYLEIPNLFAWTATVILMSVLIERLILRSMRRMRG